MSQKWGFPFITIYYVAYGFDSTKRVCIWWVNFQARGHQPFTYPFGTVSAQLILLFYDCCNSRLDLAMNIMSHKICRAGS